MKNRIIICKQCGEYRKHAGLGFCKKCYDEKYHREHREERIKKSIEYYKKHKNEFSIKKKEYYKKHKKERALYYLENKKEIAEKKKKYQAKHKKEIRIHYKKYRQSLKGMAIIKQIGLRRRSAGRVGRETIIKIINENILKYGIATREKCKKQCPNNFHIDHIVPLSKGGDNSYDNLQILCQHCNCSKYVDIADYREKIKNNQLYLSWQMKSEGL